MSMISKNLLKGLTILLAAAKNFTSINNLLIAMFLSKM